MNVRFCASVQLEHEELEALKTLATIGAAEIEHRKSSGQTSAYERPGVMLTHQQTQAAYDMAGKIRQWL